VRRSGFQRVADDLLAGGGRDGLAASATRERSARRDRAAEVHLRHASDAERRGLAQGGRRLVLQRVRERSVAAELAVEADEEELLVGQILASGDGDAVFCLSVGHGLSLLSGEASAPAVLLPRLLHEVRARRPRLADRLGTRELRVRLHELRGHLVDLLGGGTTTTIDAIRLTKRLGDRLVRCGELVARAQHLLQRVAVGLLE